MILDEYAYLPESFDNMRENILIYYSFLSISSILEIHLKKDLSEPLKKYLSKLIERITDSSSF